MSPQMAGIVGVIFGGALQLESAIVIAAETSIEGGVEKRREAEGKAGFGSYEGRAAAFWFVVGIAGLAHAWQRDASSTRHRRKFIKEFWPFARFALMYDMRMALRGIFAWYTSLLHSLYNNQSSNAISVPPTHHTQ
jgi:hypothetical protein